MKKLNILYIVALILFTILLFPARAQAVEPGVLKAGMEAEGRQQWNEALTIYRRSLATNPGQTPLWLRVANIEARLKNTQKVVDALAQAARLNPGKPEILAELSRAYAMNNQPKDALDAMEHALKIEPENVEFLKARAQLANWRGKPKIAADSYYRLIKLMPKEESWVLGLAFAHTWSGKLDRAAGLYRKYFSKHVKTEDLPALVQYIKVQTWRGDYASALKLNDMYLENGGDKEIYRRRKADILSRGGRPRAGMKELQPLLTAKPDDYEMQTARTIALHYDHRPVEALKGLEELERMRPQSLENKELRRFISTPLRHKIPASSEYYSDSIGIDIFSNNIGGEIRLHPNVLIKGGYSHHYLEAPVESAFNNIDGTRDATHTRQWAGAAIQLGSSAKIDGYAGSEKSEDLPAALTYSVTTSFKLSDQFNVSFNRNLQYFLISPRAASLGIRMTTNQIDFNWEPGLKTVLPMNLRYDTLSDGNSRWSARFAPRFLFKRSARFNLDLGAGAWLFGYKHPHVSNGYWAPHFYQSYMGIANGYIKFGENSGMDFRGEAGVLKADTMDRFMFGWTVDAQGVFGIFGDLMLKLRATYMRNSFRVNQVFTAYLISASIEFRF